MDYGYHVKHVYIEKDCRQYPLVDSILDKRKKDFKITWIDSIEDIHLSKIVFEEGGLVLSHQKGQFFKSCPCTKKYVCCGYYFLNVGHNCHLNCSYCILQGYLGHSVMVAHVNLQDLFAELDQVLDNNPDLFYRIGTGELTDSFVVDSFTHLNAKLIDYFSKKNNAVLELKTKSTAIDQVLDCDHNNRTVLAWSLNTQKMIESDEKLSASLTERIFAAQKAVSKGYYVGFHFDPLIHYEGWEKDYRDVLTLLFDSIEPSKIAWISLGALRYPKEMDGLIRKNHPQSSIMTGELFPGLDGKMRYLRPIREMMFSTMLSMIKSYDEHLMVYLCMESLTVWNNVFGHGVLSECSLSEMIAGSYQQKLLESGF